MSESARLAGELAALEADINLSSEKVGASVWRLGPGGTMITSVIEGLAPSLAETDSKAIYFYADLYGSSELKHDEGTMQKVYTALSEQGLSEKQIINSVNSMQNAGIYFREANF